MTCPNEANVSRYPNSREYSEGSHNLNFKPFSTRHTLSVFAKFFIRISINLRETKQNDAFSVILAYIISNSTFWFLNFTGKILNKNWKPSRNFIREFDFHTFFKQFSRFVRIKWLSLFGSTHLLRSQQLYLSWLTCPCTPPKSYAMMSKRRAFTVRFLRSHMFHWKSFWAFFLTKWSLYIFI